MHIDGSIESIYSIFLKILCASWYVAYVYCLRTSVYLLDGLDGMSKVDGKHGRCAAKAQALKEAGLGLGGFGTHDLSMCFGVEMISFCVPKFGK